MAYGTPSGQPLKPRRWNNPGDGSVCLVAVGPEESFVRDQVQRACADLGLPFRVCNPLDIETILLASVLILYGDVDHGNPGSPYSLAPHAQVSKIPIIVLYKSDANVFEVVVARSLAGRSAIAFGAAPIEEQLREAIARNFVRVQVTYLAEKNDWDEGTRDGVLEAFTYDGFQVLPQSHTPGDRAWIQRSRVLVMQCYDALVVDRQSQMARAAQIAEDIINRAGYTTFPIPVEKIVKDHGLIITPVHLDGLSGRIKNIGESGYIEVNKDEPATRQNFTIAHEFGHWLMSHGQHCFRSASGKWVLRPKEDAADAFAAGLLMPPRLIKREFERLKEQGHTYDAIVREMVWACHVGERAMRRRLGDLGLTDWLKS